MGYTAASHQGAPQPWWSFFYTVGDHMVKLNNTVWIYLHVQ